MNNVFDKFLDDLEEKLADNKPAIKADTVTISVGYYEELVAASVKLDILQELYSNAGVFDFDRLAGVVLGVERPKVEVPPVTLPDAKDVLECPTGCVLE